MLIVQEAKFQYRYGHVTSVLMTVFHIALLGFRQGNGDDSSRRALHNSRCSSGEERCKLHPSSGWHRVRTWHHDEKARQHPPHGFVFRCIGGCTETAGAQARLSLWETQGSGMLRWLFRGLFGTGRELSDRLSLFVSLRCHVSAPHPPPLLNSTCLLCRSTSWCLSKPRKAFQTSTGCIIQRSTASRKAPRLHTKPGMLLGCAATALTLHCVGNWAAGIQSRSPYASILGMLGAQPRVIFLSDFGHAWKAGLLLLQ